MSPGDPVRDKIVEQLQEAVDRLRADLARVEIWASALDVFARPVPDYDPSSDLDHHRLPRHDANRTVHRQTPGRAGRRN